MINNFNEGHIYTIQSKDDLMQGQMNGWMNSYFDTHRKAQYTRNRGKILEIKTLIAKYEEEIVECAHREEQDEGEEEM